MCKQIKVISLSISEERKGPKKEVESVNIDNLGIVGDSHSGLWHRQISMLTLDAIKKEEVKRGIKISPGACAENIVVDGIKDNDIYLFDEIEIGDVRLEVTQFGKKDDIDPSRFGIIPLLPKYGIFLRVKTQGKIEKGMHVKLLPKLFKIKIITLSDRAHAGEYEDKSGPLIKDQLDSFFDGKRFRHNISLKIIPDSKERLILELEESKMNDYSCVFTTGSTGIGPRDIAPDVVLSFCDKIIPGVMDSIRIKFGLENPNALLSRSVCGIKEDMPIFALPGSPKAVKEYMEEILKLFEHLILMAKGIGH